MDRHKLSDHHGLALQPSRHQRWKILRKTNANATLAGRSDRFMIAGTKAIALAPNGFLARFCHETSFRGLPN